MAGRVLMVRTYEGSGSGGSMDRAKKRGKKKRVVWIDNVEGLCLCGRGVVDDDGHFDWPDGSGMGTEFSQVSM